MNKLHLKQKDKFQVYMLIFRKFFKREYLSKICDSKELFGYIATQKLIFLLRKTSEYSIQKNLSSQHKVC